MVDYKGYEVTDPPTPIFPNKFTVNLCSNNRHLFNKLGGRNVVIDDHASIKAAVAKAKRYVDELG